ncbi:thioredoxin domain-containing protein [bacterium]|nr:thioredoxin domain-containing protein [bacterium]
MNELGLESSPYLLQHTNNPVHWKAWNSKTIELVQQANKPVLLSIGYATCHWCHVMEHESFEDEEVAKYMNEHFICIKIDREERPDIDQIYMTAANIITGRGGWPLNCFTLPNLQTFHAGTYYPKDAWLNILEQVQTQFHQNKLALEDYAQKLTRGIEMQETLITDETESDLDPKQLDKAVLKWLGQWDLEEGGIKGAPKFPLGVHYDFLLEYYRFHPEESVMHFCELSLNKMACSGLYDQLEGGFARYAVDDKWKVPHFEKMLYDNALLMKVYAKLLTYKPSPMYREILNDTYTWLEHKLKAQNGLYYSAMDADSEGIEGKYYTWTLDELQAIPELDFNAVQQYFDLGNRTLWEEDRHILHRNPDIKNRTKEQSEIIQTLLAQRNTRVKPITDIKCLSSWNGLLITAFTTCYKASLEPKWKKAAIELSDSCIHHFLRDSTVYHSVTERKTNDSSLLEDYAFLGQGLFDVFQISGDSKYLELAQSLCETALNRFYHHEKGVFYSSDDKNLITQFAELYDSVTPSTNASMALLLYQLGVSLIKTDFIEISRKLVSRMTEHIQNHPASSAYWGKTHLCFSENTPEIVVVGAEARTNAEHLMNKFPEFIVMFSDENSDVLPFKGRFITDETRFYICYHGSCDAPLRNLDEVIDRLESL